MRALLRQVDPVWPYRAECAKRADLKAQAEPMGWARAPLATAFVSTGWQLVAVGAVLAATFLLLDGGAAGLRGTLLLVAFGGAGFLFFLGALAQVHLVFALVRRREWTLLLGGMDTVVVLLRGLEYAFAPRRPCGARDN